jgi:hypothetical protein
MDVKCEKNFDFEGNKPLGGPRRRWEDNIKIDFKETG